MVGSYIQSLKMMNDVDIQHILENESIQDTFLKVREPIEMPRHNMLGWRAQERLQCTDMEMLPELYTWVYWLTRSGTDDYYFRPAYRQMMLYSGFSDGEYDCDTDFDSGDYVSFRSGYSPIKRILIKIKTWPSEVDGRSLFTDRLRMLLKETIEKIANYIAAFLRENKDKCTALRQAWEACDVVQPIIEPIRQAVSEHEFRRGIKRAMTSTPDPTVDEVDGPRVKRFMKRFSASLPAINLNCTSSAMEIEPCLSATVLQENTIEAIAGPSTEPMDTSSKSTEAMDIVPTVPDLMTTQEMFDLVQEMDKYEENKQ